MINLYTGELLDMLPSQMATQVQQQCISYALKKGIQLVIEQADRTRTVAMIDSLPERILDILAVELRTPYYREEMEIRTKQEIIKRTVMWHLTAGTPRAVEELVATVFGEGKVKEWFEYGGVPYRFKIVTNALLTENMNAFFSEMIEVVKNMRSHIEAIEIHRTIQQDLYIGIGQCTPQYRPAAIIDGYSAEREVNHITYSAAGWCSLKYKPAAIMESYEVEREEKYDLYIGIMTSRISYPESIAELGLERKEV